MIDAKDWPLEVEDHVVLERDILLQGDVGSLIVFAGTHGVVKNIPNFLEVYVEFKGMFFHITNPRKDLSLYRRSQHSKRRSEHDARRRKKP